MSVDSLRNAIGRLGASAHALSAIGAALSAKASGSAVAPAVREALQRVLAAQGLSEAVADVGPAAGRALLGEIRVAFLQGLERLRAPGGHPGWHPEGTEILEAAGEVSVGFPALLQRSLSDLDGLDERLTGRAARFLDVGVGVAALSIEMARLWPELRITGIDVWAPALALARENVGRAGLETRVELREQAVQTLPDVDAFDLAWIPSAFLAVDVVAEGLRRVRRALKPGSWVIFASLAPGGDPLADALTRLRAAEWGSAAWTPADATRLLQESGFADLRALPTSPGSLAAFTAGRAGG